MSAVIVERSLRDQARGFVAWAIATGLLVFAIVALWPSVRAMPDIERFLENYPEALKDLFNMDAFRTGAGYLNAELFSIMLPAMFLVFAIGRGARAIAGEERSGSLEMVLASPVSRTRLLLEKAAAVALSTTALGAVLAGTAIAAAAAFGLDASASDIALASLVMVVLAIEHGWLAVAVGAATGRRGLSVAVAGAVAGAGYVLYVVGTLVDAARPWRVLSPFHQALDGGPVGAGWRAGYLVMAAIAVAAIAIAAPMFDRRDVHA